MACESEKTREALACPVDPYCLGMCLEIARNVIYSVVNLEPRPERELQLLPSSRTEPHPSYSPERFALASDEELAFTDTELDELSSLVDM